MPLGDRIKALRTQAGWSQGQLAERVGTDARQISRYENSRITPSLDVLARIAETLDTSLDHLVFDDIPPRPLHAKADVLGDRLTQIADLDPDALNALTNVIDGLIAKNRLRALADDIS
jgi:transcriptional regulator with XRE-family HTH domain